MVSETSYAGSSSLILSADNCEVPNICQALARHKRDVVKPHSPYPEGAKQSRGEGRY